jgi:phage terminase small subunit
VKQQSPQQANHGEGRDCCTQAAIRAGYSAKTAEAIGHENLRKPKIAEKLEKARAERAERCALSADWVVEELRKIADANMLDYMKSTPQGING